MDVRRVLARLDVVAVHTRAMAPNHGPDGNLNWHVWPRDGERCVLRCYYAGMTPADLAYEHTILDHLARQGWCVPEPLAAPVEEGGRWYGLTRYVPGRRRLNETSRQRRQRGADLARMHVALRPLAERLGQRPGWRPLREGVPVMIPIDWPAGLHQLEASHPALAAWAAAAADSTADELAGLGGGDLPLTTIHGDFMAEQNVHYDGSRLAGVIDFGVAHLGSRPYELISARCYRAPELLAGYVDEVRRHDWPWTDFEEAAIEPIRRAFHLGMVAWSLLVGMQTGHFDAATIESQLARTDLDRSGSLVLRNVP